MYQGPIVGAQKLCRAEREEAQVTVFLLGPPQDCGGAKQSALGVIGSCPLLLQYGFIGSNCFLFNLSIFYLL